MRRRLRWLRTTVLALAAAGLALAACLWWLGFLTAPSGAASGAGPAASPVPLENADRQHPLYPALQLARKVEARIDRDIKDYSATLVKRERHKGEVFEETLLVKVRHQPFSAYVCRLDSKGQKSDEGIYVQGKNNNKLVGYTTNFPGSLLGTVSIDPRGPIAMDGQHYPITEIGLLNLCRRIIEIVQADMGHDECEVKFAEVDYDGRAATRVEVVHPARREHFRFHLGRVYVDRELNVPLRYEAYDWPKQPGGEPELIESYTYRQLVLNPGLSDRDFDTKNPEYRFP